MDIKDVERAVLYKLISNPKTLVTHLAKISPEDFQHLDVARKVIHALDSDNNCTHYAPTAEYFEIILRDLYRSKEEASTIAKVLAQRAKEPLDQRDIDILIKELKNHRMCREMTRIISSAASRLGDPSGADAAYSDLVNSLLGLPVLNSVSSTAGQMKEVFGDLEERLQFYFTAAKKKFPTGLKAFNETIGGFAPGELIVLTAGTGQGKCLGLGTEVLKYSGEIVPVETVRKGDLLMGSDSTPRRVLGTTRGTGELFRITPMEGSPWICNKEHVLTLAHAVTGEVIDIGLQDYLKKTKKFKHEHKLLSTGVEFSDAKKMPIDPYSLGVWYGTKANDMGTIDPLKLSAIDRRKIPQEYLTASAVDRAALLAGLIDTIGTPNRDGFEITNGWDDMGDSICFLARSLGLRVISSGIFIRMSGDCSALPFRTRHKIALKRRLKKNAMMMGFSVKSIGPGEYAGFELDGDGRFLLGDFTITHNSALMLWWAEQFLKAGANVLYASIEMSYEEIMERYHAMASATSLKKIRNKLLGENELIKYNERIIANSLENKAAVSFLKECEGIVDRTDSKYAFAISAKYPKRQSKFYILDLPKGCSPARIEREVLKISLDCPLNIVFVDYLNIMDPNSKSKDYVREQGSIAKDLKGVARKTGTVIFTGAQLNTSGMKEGEQITTDSIKYARAISENSDWVIGFKRSSNDEAMKQIRLELAKHRFSASCSAAVEIDFDTKQISDLGRADDLPTAGEKTAAQNAKRY